jgi:hypothetical protein
MEATGDHGFEQRIFVSVVIVESGAIDSGGLGDVLHGDLVEALALHEGTQGTLKELSGSPHSWIAYFAVGDWHGSLYIRGYQREKESEKQRTSSTIYDASCVNSLRRLKETDYAPTSALNFIDPYLKTIFGFMGVTDVRFVTAGGAAQVMKGAMDRETFLKPTLEAVRTVAA